MDSGAVGPLSLPEIHDGRKIQVAVYDFVALAGEVETGGNHGLAGGDVLVGRDGTFGRIHERPNLIADFGRQHPPSFFPGANPASGPGIGVAFHGVVNAAGHGTQGIADQVGGVPEDRKLGAVAEQFVSHSDIVLRAKSRQDRWQAISERRRGSWRARSPADPGSFGHPAHRPEGPYFPKSYSSGD